MATTAAAIGSPTVNQKAATTVATRKARPRQAAPGRFNPAKFQNPKTAARAKLARNRHRFQNPNAGQPQRQRLTQGQDPSIYPGKIGGGPAPRQSLGPGGPGGVPQGGSQTQWVNGQVGGIPQTGSIQGGQYPGGSPWWQQRPPMPAQQQWGSPQFNYMGGNAPSAQPQGGPNWGRSGMPGGGMPSYQGQQYGNQSYGALQDRIYQQMMLAQMPGRLRQQYQFQQGAQGMGYGDPMKYSGPGQVFQGYGTQWGQNPYGWWGGESSPGAPWTGTWGNYTPGQPPGPGGSTSGQQNPNPFSGGYSPSGWPGSSFGLLGSFFG